MTQTFHLLTGEYPPHTGGVGDYTQILAHALSARGCAVHVWCPAVDASRMDGAVSLHRLDDEFGTASRAALTAGLSSRPGCVLLQYVPNALGARGANVSFCIWLWRLGRGADVRVMFHEPYFYFGWQHPLRNGLAVVQRVMAAVLLRAASVVYFSTSAWTRYLGPLIPSRTTVVVTPIPATVANSADAAGVARWRARFAGSLEDTPVAGHFGTYGADIAADLLGVIDALMRGRRDLRFVCLGRGSDAFLARVPAQWRDRVIATGQLSRADMAAALRACDVVVQPYPDGVTTRRTSVMAALANGVATVTTTGALTEAIWKECGGVALGKAGESTAIAALAAHLLDEPEERSALAARGRGVYDTEFALDRTVDALLQAAPECAGA